MWFGALRHEKNSLIREVYKHPSQLLSIKMRLLGKYIYVLRWAMRLISGGECEIECVVLPRGEAVIRGLENESLLLSSLLLAVLTWR